jgi:SAM-dependent methyltransferase
VPKRPTFDQLIAEGDAVPVAGWDFCWFEGRASEERPDWGYARLMGRRMAAAQAALDIQTGGGEVLAAALRASGASPAMLAATESWPPNAELARHNLAEFGGSVAEVADDADLPFASQTFGLVVSRHPTEVGWPEIARVLQPGGSYFSQQVGAGSNRELTDFMMGTQPVGPGRSTQVAAAAARAAGLELVDLREQALRVEFFDVAAVVYFLRKVLWTVPGFTVAGYLEPLARMHDHIQEHGSFTSHSQRFLIEARKGLASARSGQLQRCRVIKNATSARIDARDALVAVNAGAARHLSGRHLGDQAGLAQQSPAHGDELEALSHGLLDRRDRCLMPPSRISGSARLARNCRASGSR